MKAAPSSEHSKLESTSVAVKVKTAVVAELGSSGLSWMVVSGGTATVHCELGGRLVADAERVAGRDLEGVLAVDQADVRLRRRAEREPEAVEAAEEERIFLVGREAERGAAGGARRHPGRCRSSSPADR